MKYLEWLVLFIFGSIGTAIANYIGQGTPIMNALPGLLLLVVISMLAVVCTKVLPFKLPIIAYCSLIGLLLASPWSPVSGAVIAYASKIHFTAPFSMVGAFAGMSISNQLRTFIRQGWKILIVGVVVMFSVFLGSVLWSSLLLYIANLF